MPYVGVSAGSWCAVGQGSGLGHWPAASPFVSCLPQHFALGGQFRWARSFSLSAIPPDIFWEASLTGKLPSCATSCGDYFTDLAPAWELASRFTMPSGEWQKSLL